MDDYFERVALNEERKLHEESDLLCMSWLEKKRMYELQQFQFYVFRASHLASNVLCVNYLISNFCLCLLSFTFVTLVCGVSGCYASWLNSDHRLVIPFGALILIMPWDFLNNWLRNCTWTPVFKLFGFELPGLFIWFYMIKCEGSIHDLSFNFSYQNDF